MRQSGIGAAWGSYNLHAIALAKPLQNYLKVILHIQQAHHINHGIPSLSCEHAANELAMSHEGNS